MQKLYSHPFVLLTARIELGEKVKTILLNQFDVEFNRQRNEMLEIDDSIIKVQQKLQVCKPVNLLKMND